MINEGLLEDLVRERLHNAPAPGTSPAEGLAALNRAGHVVSVRRRRNSIGLSVGMVIVLVVGVFTAARLASPEPSVANDFGVSQGIDAWPVRGDRAHNAAFINQAEEAIVSQSAKAHQPATINRVLYAGTLAVQTPGVGAGVLVATGKAGGHTVVIYASTPLTTQAQAGTTGGFVLRSLIPIDPQTPLRSVGFAEPMAAGDSLHPSSMTSTLAMSLVAPGITNAHLSSSIIDGNMTDDPNWDKVVDDGLVVDTTFAGVGPWNSTLLIDGQTDEAANMLGGALREPVLVEGVLRKRGQNLVVTTTPSVATRLTVGDVVATKAGVVGRISQVTDDAAVVDTNLASLSNHGLMVKSYASNYPGKLVQSGSSIAFQVTEETPDGVNRVVLQVAGTSAFLSIGTRTGNRPTSPTMPLLRSVSLEDLPASVPVIIVAASR